MKYPFLKIVNAIAFAAVTGICLSVSGNALASDAAVASVSPSDALARLVKGNARFASGDLQHPRQSPDRRMELAKTQRPFAVVLGCSDSRTGPELLFDQGLGDLFVVRTAGNVVDAYELGSIEYAAEHLGASLVVVLGHQRCGAVKAAREIVAVNGKADGHVEAIVNAIRPAVKATANQDAEATCKANVLNSVKQLRTSNPILEPMVRSGKLSVVGAYYDIDTGKVTFLSDK